MAFVEAYVPVDCAVGSGPDPGWPDLITELDGPDAPPIPELIDALIGVVRDWRPPKPGAIAAVPDPDHPLRVTGIIDERCRLGVRVPPGAQRGWSCGVFR